MGQKMSRRGIQRKGWVSFLSKGGSILMSVEAGRPFMTRPDYPLQRLLLMVRPLFGSALAILLLALWQRSYAYGCFSLLLPMIVFF